MYETPLSKNDTNRRGKYRRIKTNHTYIDKNLILLTQKIGITKKLKQVL